MIKSSEIREQKLKVLAEMTALVDRAEKEERHLSEKEQTQYNDLLSTVKDFDKRINSNIELESLLVEDGIQIRNITQNGAPNTSPDKPTIEFRTSKGETVKGYSKGAKMSGEKGYNVGRFMRALATGKDSGLNEIEKRTLAAGSGSGSYTIPTALSQQVIDRLRENLVFDKAGAITVPISGPTKLVSITGDPTSEWHEEGDTLTASDPTFSPVTLNPKYITCLVKVNREAIDQALNIEQAVEMALVGALKNTLEKGILSGTGADGQISGMDTWSTNINDFALGTNGDELASYEDLLYADYLLRADNSSLNAAIMSPRTFRDFNMLADTTGQPLQRPESLKMVPFLPTSNVLDTYTQGAATSNTSRIYGGDFSKLMIGVLQDIRIELLRETHAANFQFAFLAYMAVDVKPLHEASFCRVDGVLGSTLTNTYV